MSATGISKEIETAGQLEELRQEVRIAAEELLSAANMKPGQILVVGCSSSEIASHKIGSYSSAEIGKAVFEELYAVTKSQGLYLAAQCCEHLNRALIVEEEAVEAEPDPAPEVAVPEGETAQTPLSQEEYRLLQCLLYGRDYGWVRASGLMLSVLVDSINEKMFDEFADSVLTLDNGPELIEDYIQDLKERVRP